MEELKRYCEENGHALKVGWNKRKYWTVQILGELCIKVSALNFTVARNNAIQCHSQRYARGERSGSAPKKVDHCNTNKKVLPADLR